MVERRALQARTIVYDANNALLPILFAAREVRNIRPGSNTLEQQVLDGANHIATMFRTFLSSRIAPAGDPVNVSLAIAELAGILESTAGQEIRVITQLGVGIPRVAIDSNDLARVVIKWWPVRVSLWPTLAPLRWRPRQCIIPSPTHAGCRLVTGW